MASALNGARQILPLTHITAFIPYFQRDSGLLRKAVLSVFNQSIFYGGEPGKLQGIEGADWEPSSGVPPGSLDLGQIDVELLIVDDGSPVSAASELEGLAPPAGCTVRVVKKENGGLSMCRNSGLDAVRADSDYFGMLDSDDVWSPWHLERAAHALLGGADIYTSNWFTAETKQPALESMNKLRLEDHRPHEYLASAYHFVGDPFEQEARSSIWRPSCLVFSMAMLGDLRNDPKQRHGSEDQLWRFEMFTRNPSTVFSSRTEVSSGFGVSLFSGLDWRSDRSLLVQSDRIRSMRKAQRLPGFTPAADSVADRAVSIARTDISASALHMMLRLKGPKFRTLMTIGLRDPVFLITWPMHAMRVLRNRMAPKRQSPASG